MVVEEVSTEQLQHVQPKLRRRRRLTAMDIERLRPREKAFDMGDPATPGLILRVFPSGVKSWRLKVRRGGVTEIVSLGPWAKDATPKHTTLGDAHRWAERLRLAIDAGSGELAKAKAALQAQLQPERPGSTGGATERTVEAVAEDFLKVLEGQRKRPEEARATVKRDIVPVIGHLPLRALKKSDCKAVVERVTARDAKVHAGKVLGLLKQLLSYAENVEDEFINPAARLKARNLGVEHNVRDRWLNEKEIPLFWKALDAPRKDASEADDSEHSMPEPKTRAALRLLLLAATRSVELRLARWSDVDLEARTWTIPVANQKLTLAQAKKAKPFVIPLTTTAIALFEELKALAGDSPYVLASPESHNGVYSDKALGRAMRRLWRSHPELKKLPEASPHDLRRTARTWLGKLGVLPHICERRLNHSLGRIVTTYDRHDYFEERKTALLKWDQHVQRLIHPETSNVIQLPVAAGGER
jgi:integrase